MADEMNNSQSQENNAGCIGIGFSVLFPIVGFFMYFIQKKSVNNPSAYLYGALAGIVINLILQAIAAASA